MKQPKQIGLLLALTAFSLLIQCSAPEKGGKEKNTVNLSNVASKRQGHFTLAGRIHADGDTLVNSDLTVYEGTELSSYTRVINNKRFQVDFQFNKEYTVVFSKPGFYAKQVSLNTHIPDSTISEFPHFEIEVSLDQVQNNNTAGQPKPVGKIFYNAEIDNFDSEVFFDN